MPLIQDSKDGGSNVAVRAEKTNAERSRLTRLTEGSIIAVVSVLHRIRQRIAEEAYFISGHADEEMRADNIEEADVVNAILHGRISMRYTHDARGTRYRVTGPAMDERTAHVLCRFHESGDLIIITVYTGGPET